MWLQSLFFSFVQCVAVTHPVLVLVWSMLVAMRHRKSVHIFAHHDDGYVDARTLRELKAKPHVIKDDDADDESVNLEQVHEASSNL